MSEIILENVSFYHGKDTPYEKKALDNINICIPHGKITGLIGHTGSGKSTLANLIPGFYFPTSGGVFVNGKNTACFTGEELVEQFGIVPQKADLFQGTIRSNLLWGDVDADDEALLEALSLAQAKEFVLEKVLGLDEPVQQGGVNFSGGQRQRLTVARALVKKPKFLIFDDSASALDYATEAKLRGALTGLPYRPTTFIISQRTSSIMHADQILVLDDGELVGVGTHASLLEECEVYREIYRSQFPEGGDAE